MHVFTAVLIVNPGIAYPQLLPGAIGKHLTLNVTATDKPITVKFDACPVFPCGDTTEISHLPGSFDTAIYIDGDNWGLMRGPQ